MLSVLSIVCGLSMAPAKFNALYTEKVLAPDDALPRWCVEGTPLETSDEVVCMAHFLSTWDNSNHRYDDELDGLCHRQWGCSFDLIRNIWRGRLEFVGDVWHYIELKKIEK